jgi:hypothetical protein
VTDKQQLAKLNKAVAELKLTTRGYTPTGVHWREAMELINEVRKDLTPPINKVPALGPIVVGGISILSHDLTHATAGISGFPAFDDALGSPGRDVIAPEDCIVYRDSSAQGGDAFYIRGVSKIEYWVGHVVYAPSVGVRFKRGAKMADVANIDRRYGGPHVHCGINATPLIGHTLIHHTNYTHGAPTVGAQLALALNT